MASNYRVGVEREVLRNKKNPYKVYETPKVPVLVGSSKKQVLTELEGQELLWGRVPWLWKIKGGESRTEQGKPLADM